MTSPIPAPLLRKFSDFVATHFGLNFPPNRYRDLERNLLAACREFGFEDAEECLHGLYTSPLTQEQIEVLTSQLTIGETYFFREKTSFDVIEKQLLPELIAKRGNTTRRLRVWSAGCATGEEAHSLAILACRLLPDLHDWNLTILGTDINVRALRKAAEGSYREWSFRNAPPWLKRNYMQKTEDGSYRVLPHIRKHVTFAYHNLAEDAYPSVDNNTNAMDIIMCCNVLMYFQPSTIRRIARKFHSALVDGGWLIVSPGEAIPEFFPGFERVAFPSAVLFRRDGEVAQEAYSLAVAPAIIPQPEPQTLAITPSLDTTEGGACDELGTVIPSPPPTFAEAGACDEVETIAASPPPTFVEARAHFDHGRYAEAAEILQALDGPQAMALKARVYANQGLLTEALAWCDQAVAAAKLDPGLHYLRASILVELGRDNEALESLKHTLYLEQDFVLAHLALGNLLQHQGKHKEAQRPLGIALSLLRKRPRDETFPDLEGMTAGRLMEVVSAAQEEAKV